MEPRLGGMVPTEMGRGSRISEPGIPKRGYCVERVAAQHYGMCSVGEAVDWRGSNVSLRQYGSSVSSKLRVQESCTS